MTSAACDLSAGAGVQQRAAHPPRRRGLVVLTAVIGTFLASSTVPTPLYDRYAQQWGLSPASITLAFGVYALALLAALLVFGRLSDHVGRRPVVLTALVLQLLGLAVLLVADGLGTLLVGRVVQGVATGVGVGAVSAALLEVDPRRGAVVNAAAPLAGSALGGLLTAVAVTALPAPGHLAYAVVIAALLIEAVLVARLPETAQRRDGALRSLRPVVGLPPAARAAFAAAGPVVFAVYALSGLFASLGPSLATSLLGSRSAVLGVLPLVVMNVAASVTAVAVRHRPAARALAAGVLGLVVGVLLTAVAVALGSFALLLVGAAVSGVGFGSGFRGGQQLVVGEVSDGQRAGAVSLVYVVSYLGFGVPAIAAGVTDSATGDLPATALGYCAVLVGLAALSGLVLARTRTAGRR